MKKAFKNMFILRSGILLGLVTLLTTSCEKLDQTTKDTGTRGAVFSTEAGLILYTNSLYDILPTSSEIVRGDAMADYSVRSTVPDFIRPGVYDSRQSSGWEWKELRNINFFIENCTNTKVDQKIRENYIGLARFFRAWFYFDKVKQFGDVPWINTTFAITDKGLYAKRDSRQLVMDSVIADLDYAAAHITNTNKSRTLITPHVVLAFKSRVCLFEGTFRKYHTTLNLTGSADALLKQAESAAMEVINKGGFSLNTAGGETQAYRQLFTSLQPVTSEVILAVAMDPELNVFNDANWYWTSSTYGDRVSLSRTFVNTYLNIDGTPFTSNPGYQTMPFQQEVRNRDRRLQQTIRMGDYKRDNAGTLEAAPPVFTYTYTGYQPIKLTQDDATMDGGRRNTNSLPIIRYAEVLLNLAEAKAELGTITDNDWNMTIGALRRRAGITGASTTSKPTVVDSYFQTNYFPSISNPVLLEVRRERGIELVFEGFRFHDIVRWKRGPLMDQVWNGMYVPEINKAFDLNEDGSDDVYFYQGTAPQAQPGITYINVSSTLEGGAANPQKLKNGTSGEITWLTTVERKWDDKLYLYPIPETERLLNPALGQNLGWK